ncbi:phage head-tail connector protein [Paenibacillus illinoisensis]|uniref:phage head-tail connector protein n=1 Tax=Paenibacillus illinoisensis TaxID=59845 RepID=UPI000FDBC0E3|nr:phage head-tail connector protein [Paenibacillus illinoisensis]
MATMNRLEKIQALLGPASVEQGPLLSVLIEDAEADLLSWTNRQTIPSGLESALRQLVIMRYNKVGIEGQTSHSEGGVSRAFVDLPADLQRTISHHRLLKVVGRT